MADRIPYPSRQRRNRRHDARRSARIGAPADPDRIAGAFSRGLRRGGRSNQGRISGRVVCGLGERTASGHRGPRHLVRGDRHRLHARGRSRCGLRGRSASTRAGHLPCVRRHAAGHHPGVERDRQGCALRRGEHANMRPGADHTGALPFHPRARGGSAAGPAEQAWIGGFAKAIVFIREGAWGKRVYRAFAAEWERLGGILLDHRVLPRTPPASASRPRRPLASRAATSARGR